MKIYFILFCVLLTGIASGEYFGRNKIQYQNHQFMTLKTGAFKILYYPAESLAVVRASHMLHRWQARFDKVFETGLPEDQPVIIYANHGDFEQTNAISGLIPQSTGGVTEGLLNRIVVPLTGIPAEDNHVLGHELAHAYHYQSMRDLRVGLSGENRLPLWFIEGMSEYLSIGSHSSLTAMWMRDAVLYNKLPRIEQIGGSAEYFPYRYGHALWAFIAQRWGDDVIEPLFHSALLIGLDGAFNQHLGVDRNTLTLLWQNATKETFKPALTNHLLPEKSGKLLIKEEELNLSPSLSPDGNFLAYISSSGLFGIELYIADARTGKIVHQLTNSQSDSHFDALRFINSSGTWSPDSKKFAFTVFKNGDNAVAIADVSNGNVVKTFKASDVDEITSLAWSPDGRYIAVAGSRGGTGDLFLYEFKNGSVTNITNDPYAQLQPTWSPDGTKLAFITDNVSGTNLKRLTFASMKLAIMDMKSRGVQTFAIADWATHTAPQFSPDGTELYFVANPDGIPNIFKVSFGDTSFSRITNVATGVAGLTDLSPSFSISKNGQIAMTVFCMSNYQIRILDSVNAVPWANNYDEYFKNTTLPPYKKHVGIVESYLSAPVVGEFIPVEDTVSKFNSALRLYYIGQLFAGVSVDRTGPGLGGGISILFSDLLGNHLLGLSTQISGGLLDIGGEVMYLNLEHRLPFGSSLSHQSSLISGIETSGDTITTSGVPISETQASHVIERIFLDQANFWVEYPFSLNRRAELGVSYNAIYYGSKATRITIDNNQVVSRKEVDINEPAPQNLIATSAAFVGDFSFFGFVSPLLGRRYRFELEPTLGSLSFVSFLADYRQYWFHNPLTLALRAFHYGRYFGDSESKLLTPFFLGNQTLVRGYTLSSIDLNQSTDEGKTVPALDRLLGSRIAVINTELRIPIIGTDRFGLINFPYVPLELSAFIDVGLAWTASKGPAWEFSRKSGRGPVVSTGAAARVGILGAFVVQVYYAYPFQKVNGGSEFGILLSPGW